jgi:hypothetical protein
MTAEIRNLRLRGFTSDELDRNANQKHEIYLDFDNKTLRIADGVTRGGFSLLRDDLSNIKSTALNKSINAGTGTITAAGFTGPLTGNVTGNLTGNAGTVTNGLYSTGSYNNPTWLTGIAASKITGAVTSANTLSTSRNINSVAFDGSANISINTLVKSGKTVTLNSDGSVTLADGSQIDINGGYTRLKNTTQTGAQIGSPDDQNYVQTDNTGATIQVNSDSLGSLTQQNWVFDTSGNLTAPGNIVTAGNISSNAVTSSSITTTNDVTVGANVNISTKPTLKTHATNRGYVDKKAVAMAVALG